MGVTNHIHTCSNAFGMAMKSLAVEVVGSGGEGDPEDEDDGRLASRERRISL